LQLNAIIETHIAFNYKNISFYIASDLSSGII